MYKTTDEKSLARKEKRRIHKMNLRSAHRRVLWNQFKDQGRPKREKYPRSRLADLLLLIGAFSFLGWVIVRNTFRQIPVSQIELDFALAVSSIFLTTSGIIVIQEKEIFAGKSFLFGNEDVYIRGKFALVLGALMTIFGIILPLMFLYKLFP
jgi:hypothetical protein